MNNTSTLLKSKDYQELHFLKCACQEHVGQHSETENFNTAVCEQAVHAQLNKSTDKGGHGGTYCGIVTVEGGVQVPVFLKPLDKIEYNNYKAIALLAPELCEFMPTIYGTVHRNGYDYLVMENTRMKKDGSSLEQYSDIKLSHTLGKSFRKFNPIANQAEVLATRGKTKKWLNEMQMRFGAHKAPGFMVASEGNKCLRFFNYHKSKQLLSKNLANYFVKKIMSGLSNALEKADKTGRALYNTPERIGKAILDKEKESLLRKFADLERAMKNSKELAFIGASIILVEGEEGGLRPMLIDPAHICIRSDKVKGEAKAHGIDLVVLPEFDDYKKSNEESLSAIQKTIEEFKLCDYRKYAHLVEEAQSILKPLSSRIVIGKNRLHSLRSQEKIAQTISS